MDSKKLLNILCKELNRKNITLNSKIKDIEEWDSIAHLKILMEFERIYGSKIHKYKELLTAKTVKKILEILTNIK